MTKIDRSKLENYIVTSIFLPVLRKYVEDPCVQLKRPNSSWIRSSMPIRTSETNSSVHDYGSKRKIIKESAKPQYPYVIIGDFNETNTPETIEVVNNVYYNTSGELTIRIVDVGDVTRISNLAGQISQILYKYKKSEFLSKGISNMEWSVVSTPGYSSDDGELNEKQILITFNARINEWQL